MWNEELAEQYNQGLLSQAEYLRLYKLHHDQYKFNAKHNAAWHNQRSDNANERLLSEHRR